MCVFVFIAFMFENIINFNVRKKNDPILKSTGKQKSHNLPSKDRHEFCFQGIFDEL